MPNMVHWTHPAGVVPHLGREEAEARHQYYIGPEHLLVGLLQQDEFLREANSPGSGDDLAAELLQAHGLDLATVRAGIDRLVAQGALPVQPVPHAPGGGTPLTCHRVLLRACEEAVARGTDVGPLHLLLGLLRDAERPVDEGLSPGELRLRSLLGLPNSGPGPVKLLVENEDLTLENLQAAVRAELDRDH
jgi:hypothetical protein